MKKKSSKKKIIKAVIGVLLFVPLTLFIYCSSYNSKLLVPDGYGTGYNLTPLGKLVKGPWQISWGNNEAVFLNGKEISSVRADFTAIQKDLVFELQQDGSVKYWFKSSYDTTLKERTSPNEQGITVKPTGKPEGSISKIYTSGKWKFGLKDSTLTIQFDKKDIPDLIGRYSELTSLNLSFQRITYFDSLGTQYKKVVTTTYDHPWVNKL